MKIPVSVYVASPRTMPKKVDHFDYPYHFEVRRVSRNSGIRWRNRWVQISSTLAEEYIGFEEIEDGIHNVYFSDLLIGRFFEEQLKIRDVIERAPTRQTIVECGNPRTRRISVTHVPGIKFNQCTRIIPKRKEIYYEGNGI